MRMQVASYASGASVKDERNTWHDRCNYSNQSTPNKRTPVEDMRVFRSCLGISVRCIHKPLQFAAGRNPAASAASLVSYQTLFSSLMRCAPEHHGKWYTEPFFEATKRDSCSAILGDTSLSTAMLAGTEAVAPYGTYNTTGAPNSPETLKRPSANDSIPNKHTTNTSTVSLPLHERRNSAIVPITLDSILYIYTN